jgi:hypothetical protein
MEYLALVNNQMTRVAVASRNDLSRELYKKLANHSDPKVKVAVVRNNAFHLNDEWFNRFKSDGSTEVQEALARRSSLSDSQFQTLLIQPFNLHTEIGLAANKRLPVNQFQRFARSDSPEVRESFATNVLVTLYWVNELILDPVREVVTGLLKNPNPHVLETDHYDQIFQSAKNNIYVESNQKIFKMLARSHWTPLHILMELREGWLTDRYGVNLELEENVVFNREGLDYFWCKFPREGRLEVASNHALPIEMLAQYMKEEPSLFENIAERHLQWFSFNPSLQRLVSIWFFRARAEMQKSRQFNLPRQEREDKRTSAAPVVMRGGYSVRR